MKIGSSTASLPNPTPLLLLIPAIAIFVWQDAMGMTAVIMLAAVIVPMLLVLIAKRPDAAIILLLAASAAPRVSVEIGGLNARPEHILSGLVLCIAPLLWKKREQPVQWLLPDYFLMAYVGMNFFSSIFGSLAPSQTVKWAAQQVLAILPYFWLRLLIPDREKFRWAFQVLVVVGVVVSAFAIFCFYSNAFLGTDFGVELEQYAADMPATYGLQFEANLLGAYSGALAVMMLAMYLQERGRKYLIGGTFCGLVAMAVSLSRGAIGATFIGLVLIGFSAWRKRLLNARVVFSITTACLFSALLVMPFLWGNYVDRFSTVEVADPVADPNTLSRAVQTITAVDEVMKHPIFGGGTASFQLAFDWRDFSTSWETLMGWIGNTELRVLHDTGLVGLIIFSVFVFSLARRGWKLLKSERNPELVALMASAVVYVFSFQFTEGTLLAFPWVHLGLIGCAISLGTKAVNEKGRMQTASAEP